MLLHLLEKIALEIILSVTFYILYSYTETTRALSLSLSLVVSKLCYYLF